MAQDYVTYHPSARQRNRFEDRRPRLSVWPEEEEVIPLIANAMVDQKTPGSTYSPALGSDSPPNFEALGLDPVEQLMEEIMGPRGGEFEFYPVRPRSKQQLGLLPPMQTATNVDVSMTSPNYRDVDDIYNAVFKSEHSPTTRKNPWIKTRAKPPPGGEVTAWGEAQITDGTMKTAMLSKDYGLDQEERDYAIRYIGIPSDEKAQWLTGPHEIEMYRSIAKKILSKYLRDSGGDSRRVIAKWYLGPNKKGSTDDLLKLMRSRGKPIEDYLDTYLKELGL